MIMKEMKPLSKQVIEDYDRELKENDHMSVENAIRNISKSWNMPINIVKEIIING